MKLKTVESYLRAFTTALKKQAFELLYIDACAGSGTSKAKTRSGEARLVEVDDITVGSAVRALEVQPQFDRYVLNDAKRSNVKSLESVVKERFPNLVDRVAILHSDANAALANICRTTDWRRTRAVVFLDPFGLQMNFSMVRDLGRTEAVDLWYLVPVLAMSRQVKTDGSILEPGGSRIDDILGTREWRSAVVAREEGGDTDLFGPLKPSMKKVASAGWFEQVAMRQLATVFRGGVLSRALPLGRGGLHEFSLVFACANPRPAANALAKKLAAAVLK
ncbi:MAG TPA: three-Cys-motif partner protein TcmP [Allosphingosinicella sp.]